MKNSHIRHNWTLEEIGEIYSLPFMRLLYIAIDQHLEYFKDNKIKACSLLSLKTGSCPEDCSYCSQSAHYKTTLSNTELADLEFVVRAAKDAKSRGVGRICMAAAWRSPSETQFVKILSIIKEVKKLGLETCMSLGMLTKDQALALKAAGLNYYNHNLDTSKEYYREIITTRTYEDRLNTLKNLHAARIKICCGGIIGMGENISDRLKLLQELANFPIHPESVPINYFMPIPGTPLANTKPVDPIEFVRVIGVARILMPRSTIRLAAGRSKMSDELQTLCFLAGANSIFVGDKLLTTKNPALAKDKELLERLGMSLG